MTVDLTQAQTDMAALAKATTVLESAKAKFDQAQAAYDAAYAKVQAHFNAAPARRGRPPKEMVAGV